MIDPGVRTVIVRQDGLVATLFLPATPPPYPVVITLGGSGGGIFAMPALALASHGIAALALAYFRAEHLPAELKRIPLEYFGSAIHWLAERDEIRPGAIGVAGGSRGGELALLVAATYPAIKAVVGWAASGVIYGSVSRGVEPPVAAWCLGGRDLPFAGFDRTAVDWNRRPTRFAPGFMAALTNGSRLFRERVSN